MNEHTDYVPGQGPVPVGTIVLYAYTPGTVEREYTVIDHYNPLDHPQPPPKPSLEEAYPDGVAYLLWPVGVPQKFRFRDQSIGWVRRTSFRIK